MRLRFFKSFIAVLAFIVVLGCFKDATTVTFTADMVQKINTRRIEGKIFVKGNEYRMDIKEGEENISILVNGESGKHTVLVHSQKAAHEYLKTSNKSLSNNPFENFNYLFEQASPDTTGSEVINGYECAKIEIFKDNKKLLTAWVSDTLNWPIKIVSEVKPRKDVDLSNIKEGEVVKGNLFKVPKEYKFFPIKETKKEKPEFKEEKKEPVDIRKMKETVLKKLEDNGIERETEGGKIEVRQFGGTIVSRHFPGWKFFRVIRKKETEDSTSSGIIHVVNAAVSVDIKTVYLLDSPVSDTSIDIGLKIFQNDKIKLNNEEEVENFGNALVLLYFVGVRVEFVEYLGENKWAIYILTPSKKIGSFIVEVKSSGEIKGIDYKSQISE
jgi:hypothetical protein